MTLGHLHAFAEVPFRRHEVADALKLRVTGGAAPQQKSVLPTDAVSGLFEATLDAAEEAIYNSMLRATDTSGNGRTVRALPVDGLRAVLKKYGR